MIFANSNPRPFISVAHDRFWKAIGAEPTAKGAEHEELQEKIKNEGTIVNRFLSYHARCSCKKLDCKGHTHSLDGWMNDVFLNFCFIHNIAAHITSNEVAL